MTKKRAQTAIEFIIVVGFVVFFFTVFLLVIQENTEETNQERENLLARELALSVQDEIALAYNSVDGYNRNFTLPQKIAGKEYEIIVQENLVYLTKTTFAISFPVQNISGQIQKGNNLIRKEGGVVYLNYP